MIFRQSVEDFITFEGMLYDEKIGILGGGQLGKMLVEAALPLHIPLHLLDSSEKTPAAPYAPHFHRGNFRDYNDVMRFGAEMDVLSIEIESVHVGALKELEEQGKKVFPQPHLIELIQDKGTQKNFYKRENLPTAPFFLLDQSELSQAVQDGKIHFPIVQKARTGGYDGKGVSIVRSAEDLMPVDSVFEDLADIDKEISVIVARDHAGNTVAYDVVEMVFDPVGNLVDSLISPAQISNDNARAAQALALSVIERMELIGILAVEMFLLKNGDIWINEVAPRPHNSGHQTIKNTSCSQYEQLLRILAGLPLGEPKNTMPGMMVNILGATEGTGVPAYSGLGDILSIPGVHPFLYGKTESRPFRKLGHITITGESIEELKEKAAQIKSKFKVEIA